MDRPCTGKSGTDVARRWALAALTAAIGLSLIPMNSVSADERTAPDPTRWEKDIAALEAELEQHPVAPGGVVFIGSSSIRLWKLNQSFPELPAVNLGFGGSETVDSVHYFERLVTPLKPSVVVLYAGDNDIANGTTPENVCSDFRAFAAKVRSQLPSETHLIYVAIKPSLKRWALADKINKANAAIAELCAADDRLHFLNIYDPMLTADGTPDPTLFVEDGLHLNAKGYELWTEILQKQLQELSTERSEQR